MIKKICAIFVFVFLTILTQIGGVAFLVSQFIASKITIRFKFKKLVSFIVVYLLFTFILIPVIAPLFGREKVDHSDLVSPTNYMTVF